jgi:hypothetical protein
MKKLIFGGLFLAAIGIGFIGCKKMNTEMNNLNNSDSQSDFGSSRTENPYETLGRMHNDALKTMMDTMTNYDQTEDGDLFRLKLRTCVLRDFANFEGSEYFNENFVTYAFESYDSAKEFNFNITEWETCPLSVNAKDFMIEMDELIHKMAVEEIDFSLIVPEIDEIVSNVLSSSLDGFELQVVLGYIYISKYSTEFWAPEELGGQGMYDYFSTTENRASPAWEAAKKADAASSATYMLNSAVVLAAGWVPGVGIGWLGGWGVSTAIGSTFGYFSN